MSVTFLQGVFAMYLRPSSLALAIFIWCLSFTGIAEAADVQTNALDNNAPNLDNFTTESETNVAASGALVVVGYNTSKQAGLLGAGAWNTLSGFAYSVDGGKTFT